MLTHLYVLIIIIMPLVQISVCPTVSWVASDGNRGGSKQQHQRVRTVLIKHAAVRATPTAAPKALAHVRAAIVPATHSRGVDLGRRQLFTFQPELRYFDSVPKASTQHKFFTETSTPSVTRTEPLTKVTTEDSPKESYSLGSPSGNYDDIKSMLMKVIDRIELIENHHGGEKIAKAAAGVGVAGEADSDISTYAYRATSSTRLPFTSEAADNIVSDILKVRSKSVKKRKKENECKPAATVHEAPGKHIKWGHWTDWSSCSVTCGKGRQIRWRHCIEACDEAETEMEEKICQLPACGPGKLWGVIKLP